MRARASRGSLPRPYAMGGQSTALILPFQCKGSPISTHEIIRFIGTILQSIPVRPRTMPGPERRNPSEAAMHMAKSTIAFFIAKTLCWIAEAPSG